MKFFEGVGRLVRDIGRSGPEFRYDPNLVSGGPNEPAWRREGKVFVVGPEYVRVALEAAKNFGTPDAATAIGLSRTYIEKHFPEALADLQESS